METKFEFAKQIVQEAAAYILAHMKEYLQVERKSFPTDLVTRLDKEVQQLLVDRSCSFLLMQHICPVFVGLLYGVLVVAVLSAVHSLAYVCISAVDRKSVV